jgi:hypothetical protein
VGIVPLRPQKTLQSFTKVFLILMMKKIKGNIMKNYVQIRIETLKTDKVESQIKHELRTVKIKSVTNENPNWYYIHKKYTPGQDGKHLRGYISKESRKSISQHLFDDLDNRIDTHKKRMRTHQKRTLNTKRVNSFSMGVLTFSELVKDIVKDKEGKDKLHQIGKNAIDEIIETLGSELYYVTVHYDEEGLPHFHFMMDGFDKEGRSISMRSKDKKFKDIGSKLQDIVARHFKELGFKRGEKKTLTGKKHLSPKEYKEYIKTKESIKKLEKENEELKSSKEILQNSVNNLSRTLKSVVSNTKYSMDEINSVIRDIHTFQVDFKGKSSDEIFDLLERYSKSESNKFDKFLEKLMKVTEKHKKNLEETQHNALIELRKIKKIKDDKIDDISSKIEDYKQVSDQKEQYIEDMKEYTTQVENDIDNIKNTNDLRGKVKPRQPQ